MTNPLTLTVQSEGSWILLLLTLGFMIFSWFKDKRDFSYRKNYEIGFWGLLGAYDLKDLVVAESLANFSNLFNLMLTSLCLFIAIITLKEKYSK
jgi:outer membrane protease